MINPDCTCTPFDPNPCPACLREHGDGCECCAQCRGKVKDIAPCPVCNGSGCAVCPDDPNIG